MVYSLSYLYSPTAKDNDQTYDWDREGRRRETMQRKQALQDCRLSTPLVRRAGEANSIGGIYAWFRLSPFGDCFIRVVCFEDKGG